MKKNMIFFAAAALFIVFSIKSFSQIDKSSYYNFGEKFYVDIYSEPTIKCDSAEINVMFRLSHDVIVFKKLGNTNAKGAFSGNPSIEIQLKDTTGIIRKRLLWDDTVYVDTFDQTIDKSRFVFGCISLKASFGIYEIVFQINDKYSQKIKKTSIKLNLDPKIKEKPTVYQPIFINGLNHSGFTFEPVLLKGNLSYTSRDAYAIFPVSFISGRDNFQYSLKKIQPETESNEPEWGDSPDYNGIALAAESEGIILTGPCKVDKIELVSDSKKFQKFNETSDKFKIGLLKIQLPLQSLSPGNYELSLSTPGSPDSAKFSFKVIWENQPLSLKELDYAIEMMYYIMTDDEYEILKKGPEKEQFKKLLNYWKAKDPTPTTPYNEAMAEYFKRVDYAFFNYQTAIQKDGAKTDRGKIYILNGAPTKIENILLEGKLTDIWKYDNLKKSFFFEAVSSGVYRLVKIQ